MYIYIYIYDSLLISLDTCKVGWADTTIGLDGMEIAVGLLTSLMETWRSPLAYWLA
jgi:hypothetical protein